MQTTLRLNDELYRKAKAAAAQQGITLTRFIEEALTLRLKRPQLPEKTELPTFDSGTDGFLFTPDELKKLVQEADQAYDLAKLSKTGA